MTHPRIRPSDSLKFIALSLAYTAILLLLGAALQASVARTGKPTMNFEYRVF